MHFNVFPQDILKDPNLKGKFMKYNIIITLFALSSNLKNYFKKCSSISYNVHIFIDTRVNHIVLIMFNFANMTW